VSTEAIPAAAAAGGSELTPEIAAGICAIVPLVGGIIFLALEKKNAFVRFWAMQSVFFGGAIVLLWIVISILSAILLHIPFIGWLMIPVVWLIGAAFGIGSFVVWVITIIKAFSNVEWEIPYLGKLARKQLAGEKLF